MKEIHNFLKRLFCLVLSCHIFEGNACLLLNISLCAAFADAAHHSAAFVHTAHKEGKHSEKKDCREKHTQHSCKKSTQSIRRLRFKNNICSFQTFGKRCLIFHLIGVIRPLLKCVFLIFRNNRHDFRANLQRHFFYLVFLDHFNKFVVRDLT